MQLKDLKLAAIVATATLAFSVQPAEAQQENHQLPRPFSEFL